MDKKKKTKKIKLIKKSEGAEVSLKITDEEPIKDRVVLALSTDHAKMLSAAMKNIAESYKENCEEKEFAEKISNRIDKTILKQAVLKEFEKQGIKPTKEQIKQAMETAK